jgi:hypothetical protein
MRLGGSLALPISARLALTSSRRAKPTALRNLLLEEVYGRIAFTEPQR